MGISVSHAPTLALHPAEALREQAKARAQQDNQFYESLDERKREFNVGVSESRRARYENFSFQAAQQAKATRDRKDMARLQYEREEASRQSGFDRNLEYVDYQNRSALELSRQKSRDLLEFNGQAAQADRERKMAELRQRHEYVNSSGNFTPEEQIELNRQIDNEANGVSDPPPARPPVQTIELPGGGLAHIGPDGKTTYTKSGDRADMLDIKQRMEIKAGIQERYDAREAARMQAENLRYLQDSSAATGEGGSGVVPKKEDYELDYRPMSPEDLMAEYNREAAMLLATQSPEFGTPSGMPGPEETAPVGTQGSSQMGPPDPAEMGYANDGAPLTENGERIAGKPNSVGIEAGRLVITSTNGESAGPLTIDRINGNEPSWSEQRLRDVRELLGDQMEAAMAGQQGAHLRALVFRMKARMEEKSSLTLELEAETRRREARENDTPTKRFINSSNQWGGVR